MGIAVDMLARVVDEIGADRGAYRAFLPIWQRWEDQAVDALSLFTGALFHDRDRIIL
jgi:hypothetical protein